MVGMNLPNKMIEPEHGMRHNSVPAYLSNQFCGSVVAPVGLPATKRCEPRQARKGAAAAATLGAGVRWAGVAIPFCYSGCSVLQKLNLDHPIL
jgi:hypothetical protein